VKLLGERGIPLPTLNPDRSPHFVHEGIPQHESTKVGASKRGSLRPEGRKVRA
jgi:hypothetical protein